MRFYIPMIIGLGIVAVLLITACVISVMSLGAV